MLLEALSFKSSQSFCLNESLVLPPPIYTAKLSFVFPSLLHTIDAVHANFLTWSLLIRARSLFNTVSGESCIRYCDEMRDNKRSIHNVQRGNIMTRRRSINWQPCSARRNGAMHSFLEKPQL